MINKNTVWKHKITGEFIHIKEVTHYCDSDLKLDNAVASIVSSCSTEYLNDSTTNVLRQVLTHNELKENYVYVGVYVDGKLKNMED